MNVKTSDLKGVGLEWAVAQCMGHTEIVNYETYIRIYPYNGKKAGYTLAFSPLTDWSIGGKLIEKYKINVTCPRDVSWSAEMWVDEFDKITGHHRFGSGDTPLEAVMRCYVTSKLGDEIEVPDELIEE